MIALALFWVLFLPYPLEPLLDVLSTHHRSATAASIGQAARSVPHFQVGGCTVHNWNKSDVYGEGIPWGGPPRIQCNLFRCLAFHRLKAWPCLNFHCSTVPSFEVPKCFLDVSSPELGFNGFANLFSSGSVVIPQRSPDASLQPVPTCAAEPASSMQHRTMGNQPPCLHRYPIVTQMLFQVRVDNCCF
jgi:hypothetical protein